MDPKKLHPKVEQMLGVFLARAKAAGLNVRPTHGYRTNAEQAALYAQGRTRPGRVVTTAPATWSVHEYGLAFDIAFVGSNPYPSDNRLWERLGAIGEALGLSWGGRWASFPDRPHFQWTDGLTIAQLRAGIRPRSAPVAPPPVKIDTALAARFENKFLLSVDEAGKVYHVRGGKRYLVPARIPMETYVLNNNLATGIKLPDLQKIPIG